MNTRLLPLTAALLIGVAYGQSPPAPTAPAAPPTDTAPQQAEAPTAYGWQLMSEEERAAYRRSMRTMTPEAREAFRRQHHETMKLRAKERGVTLPDEPLPPRGPGPGAGQGMGAGPGAGGGGGRQPRMDPDSP